MARRLRRGWAAKEAKGFLKITGLAALALSTVLGFADLRGWLKHSGVVPSE
jgi:hypothetical protein